MENENKETGIEKKGLTIEDFESKYVPTINQIASLVLSHTDIPDEIVQDDLLIALTTVTQEMRATLSNRVPEIVKLQEEVAKLDRHNKRLQETNHRLNLRVGEYREPDREKKDETPKKMSFEEIKRVIDGL